MEKTKRKNPILKILICLAILVVVCIAGFFIYTANYYHSTVSIDELSQEHKTLTYREEKNLVTIYPEDPSETGIIFYPGGKVEFTAYASQLTLLAEEGYTCYIVKMPLNFAFLDMDAASNVIERNAEINSWYLAGHSLGGAMAEAYAADNTKELDGLILLAAYGTKDISDTGLRVLNIYGSNDQVLNMDKMKSNEKNLPSSLKTVEINEGNHAQFGTYGEQKGDGIAEISPERQREDAAKMMLRFINGKV